MVKELTLTDQKQKALSLHVSSRPAVPIRTLSPVLASGDPSGSSAPERLPTKQERCCCAEHQRHIFVRRHKPGLIHFVLLCSLEQKHTTI